jgi:hypothetical protein
VGDTTGTITVDTTLSELDLEETLQSPISAPRVGNKPIIHALLITPANNLDSVSTLKSGILALHVDTTRVVEEVIIDLHTSINRAVGEEFGLDGGGILELLGGEELSGILGDLGAILAGPGFDATSGGLSSLTRGVWAPAIIGGGTEGLEVEPWVVDETTIATEVEVVTINLILRGEGGVDGSIAEDAEPI